GRYGGRWIDRHVIPLSPAAHSVAKRRARKKGGPASMSWGGIDSDGSRRLRMSESEDQQGETTQIKDASGTRATAEGDGQTTVPPLGNKSAVKDRIEQLRELKARAAQGGGLEAIERQHARGKLSARERLELLL